jgi:uroporphyrinogen-III synthase
LIVLTRDPDGNRRWAKQLERAGMGVYQAPMIRTETLELNDKMRHVLERLAGHDWLVLTSARAVQALQSLLQEAAIKPIRPRNGKSNSSRLKLPPWHWPPRWSRLNRSGS